MMSRYFERDYETQENKVLKISQYEIGGVGHIVWDAAIVLAKYLEKQIKNNKLNIKNKQEKKKFIELGAGTGIVGLVLASYEINITLTDLNEVLELLNKNLTDNRNLIENNNCRIHELNWLDYDLIVDKYDYIIIADCIYYEQSCEPLIKCLERLSDTNTVIYCSYEQRDLGIVPEIQERFFKLANEKFNVQLVDNCDLDDEYQSNDIKVYQMRLK